MPAGAVTLISAVVPSALTVTYTGVPFFAVVKVVISTPPIFVNSVNFVKPAPVWTKLTL